MCAGPFGRLCCLPASAVIVQAPPQARHNKRPIPPAPPSCLCERASAQAQPARHQLLNIANSLAMALRGHTHPPKPKPAPALPASASAARADVAALAGLRLAFLSLPIFKSAVAQACYVQGMRLAPKWLPGCPGLRSTRVGAKREALGGATATDRELQPSRHTLPWSWPTKHCRNILLEMQG